MIIEGPTHSPKTAIEESRILDDLVRADAADAEAQIAWLYRLNLLQQTVSWGKASNQIVIQCAIKHNIGWALNGAFSGCLMDIDEGFQAYKVILDDKRVTKIKPWFDSYVNTDARLKEVINDLFKNQRFTEVVRLTKKESFSQDLKIKITDQLVDLWSQSSRALDLLEIFIWGELPQYATPVVIEQCVRSACQYHSGANFLLAFKTTTFRFVIKQLSSDRFRDILLEEGKGKELLWLVGAHASQETPFDLNTSDIEEVLTGLSKDTLWKKQVGVTVITIGTLEKFPFVRMPESFYREQYDHYKVTHQNLALLLKAHAALPVSQSPYLTRITQVFGVDCPEKYFLYCTKHLGIPVFENDPQRLPELEARIQELRQERLLVLARLLKGDITAEYLKENPLRIDLLMDVVRFDRSEWGDHATDDLVGMAEELDGYHDHMTEKRGPLDPLPPEYVSGMLTVELKGDAKPVAFSDDFILKFKGLVTDVEAAREEMTGSGHTQRVNMRHLVRATKELLQHIKQDIQKTQTMQQEQGNAKALPRLEKALTDINAIDLRTPTVLKERIGDLIALAAEFANKDQEVRARQLLLMLTFQRDMFIFPDALATMEQGPTQKNIAGLEDIVNHLTYKETWLPLVKDEKRYVKALRKLLPTKFLSDKLAEFEDKGSSKMTEINVHPARGMALETSGHMADACWASKYDSINVKFPNFLTVVFTRKAKTGEEVVGSSLLIETTTKSGEKALVIRGLNPLQKIMGGDAGSGSVDHGSLLPQSFVAELKHYLEPIARARGAKLGIVIDNHSGGSGTNRPVLHAYLYHHLRPTLKKMPLASDNDTKFNGYSIMDCTYYL